MLTALPALVYECRCVRGLSLRDVERQTGVSDSSINRFENGRSIDLANAIALLKWVGQP